MRLRTDLLKYLTEEDIIESALANLHRYRAEPTFAKTGVGYLAPTTPEDREADRRRCEELALRLERRAREDGEKPR